MNDVAEQTVFSGDEEIVPGVWQFLEPGIERFEEQSKHCQRCGQLYFGCYDCA